jgi:hypothetical protein
MAWNKETSVSFNPTLRLEVLILLLILLITQNCIGNDEVGEDTVPKSIDKYRHRF